MSISYDDKRVWQNIHQDLKDGLLLRTVSSLECSICSEVMHVPFLAICGHSFCYGCLDAWFETKVNCPTCRKDMDEPPILNIQLRDISKSVTDLVIDTLEDDKHKEELIAARKTLLDEYEQASKNQKLFRRAFDSAPTLIDRSDGVPRCGNCHWEAHGAVCLHCGTRFRQPRGDSYYDSEDGDAYNEDQEEIEWYGVDQGRYDSEDSFVDNRGDGEIHNDRHTVSDDLLSSGDEDANSGVESWDGFRRDTQMFRGDDYDSEGAPLADTVHVGSESEVMSGGENESPANISDSDHESGFESDDVRVTRRSRRGQMNPSSNIFGRGAAHFADYEADEDSGDESHTHSQSNSDEETERNVYGSMEHAVDRAHARDTYDAGVEALYNDRSNPYWQNTTRSRRRPIHVIDSDSE